MTGARKLLAVCVTAVSFAAAATAKEDLHGFNGVTFASKIGVAKKQPGSSAKANRDPADATLKTLIGHTELYREKFSVKYSFDHAETFVAAYAIAVISGGDYAACRSRWDKVRGGVVTASCCSDDMDQLRATVQSKSMTFKFDNGNRVEASILGCVISIDFFSSKAG